MPAAYRNVCITMDNITKTIMCVVNNCTYVKCGFVVSKYVSWNDNMYISSVYMFVDHLISYDTKVVIAILCAGLWIYFRTSDCYKMIPRMHIFPVLFVMVWTYLNYYEPLFLPIGLVTLIAYSKLHK